MKAKVTVTPKKMSNKAQNSENNSPRQCEECGKMFLRTGNLQRHKESKTCTSKSQSSSLAHKPASSTLQITLSKIKEQSIRKEPEQVSGQKQKQLALELKGSAQRRVASKRKTVRFTDKQKEIMDRCFDSGAKKKSARYTPAHCQKEMERQSGADNALKEAQIRAYFSRRHAKLSKEE